MKKKEMIDYEDIKELMKIKIEGNYRSIGAVIHALLEKNRGKSI